MSEDALTLLQTLPPVIERYELKYIVPVALVEPISNYVEMFCALDAHSDEHDDQFYSVNSLYFDTLNFCFLKSRMWGSAHRFNMRVRAYGDGSSGPYFAEVKYKNATCVKKFRATLDTAQWPQILSQDSPTTDFAGTSDKECSSRQLFFRLAHAYAIEPKIFTCYRRRAFVSTMDDYARVTFDIDMCYRAQDPQCSATPYSLKRCTRCVNYDAQTVYGDEVCSDGNVVLELKATPGAVPLWMVELIRRFELKQVGFSKYMHSSLVEHIDNGVHYMERDRVAVPM